MKVAVLGLWHLGSVTAACTAALAVSTIGIDYDPNRVEALSRAEPPLFEPGLAELLRHGIASGTLRFAADPAAAGDADVVWVCYDTPVDDDDRADITFVMRSVERSFDYIKDGAVVLISAQLPVGSIRQLEFAYAERNKGRRVSFACSPENLRLGQAIQAFRNPTRIVVGVRDDHARSVLKPLLNKISDNLIWMSVESAEMVKHAINAFLATSITFTNEVATICERVGADAAEVEAGLRSEPRIGQRAYVKAGPAFAGGTLARDVNFLNGLARAHGIALPVIDGVLVSNRSHAHWAINQLRRLLFPLRGKTVTVLGLAYKAGTSSVRRSAALELIASLLKEGAMIRVFDPQVKSLPPDLAANVVLASDVNDAARGADAVVIATEWPEFRNLPANEIVRAMAGNIVLDAGGYLSRDFSPRPGLKVYSVGRII